MNLNGVLSGDIPEGATIKPYTLNVCVKDLSGNSACDDTVLDVSDGYVTIGDPLKGRKKLSYKEFEDIWRFVGIVVKQNTQNPGNKD